MPIAQDPSITPESSSGSNVTISGSDVQKELKDADQEHVSMTRWRDVSLAPTLRVGTHTAALCADASGLVAAGFSLRSFSPA